MLATTLRRPRALVPALLLAAAAALPASTALASPLPTTVAGPCADESGVTVVVDSTELEGDVAVGCATDPATGTEALAQAGFSETRDPSGLVCAVGGLPDPCPTEFTGSYWTYWTAAPGGDWIAYAEGPDTAVPAPGSVEGWRYGDGTQPPAAAPADVTPGAAAEAAPEDEADDAGAGADEPALTTGEDGSADAPAADDADNGGDGMSLAVGAGVGIAIVAGLVALIVRLRRNAQHPAQD